MGLEGINGGRFGLTGMAKYELKLEGEKLAREKQAVPS